MENREILPSLLFSALLPKARLRGSTEGSVQYPESRSQRPGRYVVGMRKEGRLVKLCCYRTTAIALAPETGRIISRKAGSLQGGVHNGKKRWKIGRKLQIDDSRAPVIDGGS